MPFVRPVLVLAALVLPLAAASCDAQTPTAQPRVTSPTPGTPPGSVRTSALTPRVTRITVADLPAPFATTSATKGADVVDVPADAVLNVPDGFAVQVFAEMNGPRAMAVTPEGDVLVAESQGHRLVRLRDADGDGVAEAREVVATRADNGLNRPFGLVVHRGALYVASTDKLVRFDWPGGSGAVTGMGTTLATFPGGGHWTRGLALTPDSSALFVAIGSRSNVDVEEAPRATIQRVPLAGGTMTTFADGLRNPVGMDVHPATGVLYTVVNERDGLGDDLVPDFLTSVQSGAFYGWPYTYLTPAKLDPRRMRDGASERPDLAVRTTTPEVLFQAHSAALGIAFGHRTRFPARYQSGAFVAMRGSWNRSEGTGYKIAFVPFTAAGRAEGGYEDFLTGFLTDPSGPTTFARPVGLVVARDGSLLLSEDGNGRIYRISHRGR